MSADDKVYGEYLIVEESKYRAMERAEADKLQLVMNGNAQFRALRAEVDALRRALGFYAERASWRPRGLVPKVPASEDRGDRARKALGIVG